MGRKRRHIPLNRAGEECESGRGHPHAPCFAADAVGGGLGPPGELRVRRVWGDEGLVLWFSGELDRSTCALLEREVHAAQPERPRRTTLDLTGLEFIDSDGLKALVRAQARARAEGALLLIRGSRITEELLAGTSGEPPGSPTSDEHYYFALAMACVDVDHQRAL